MENISLMLTHANTFIVISALSNTEGVPVHQIQGT